MSAWSEAVWIVQQMQKQFQANGLIQQYEQQLNNLLLNLNTLQKDIDDLNEKANIFTPIISSTLPAIQAQEGRVWFHCNEQNLESLPIEAPDENQNNSSGGA